MVPVNGFFEYGIAALLGAVVMMALGVWALVDDSTREVDVFSPGAHEGTAIPDHPLHKEAV